MSGGPIVAKIWTCVSVARVCVCGGGGVKTLIIFGICLCTFTLSPPVIKMPLLFKVSAVVIGASLSEPHTSVTALRTCVCMSVCLSVCGHIPKILNERV